MMKIIMNLLVAFSLATLTLSCTANEEPFDLIIYNANIIDVKEGEIIPNQLIGINGDTIVAVLSMNDSASFRSEKRLNLKGRYIMPGLWDNHVHFRGGDSLVEENKKLLPLFLAYGITSVRDAGGDISPTVFEWKNKIIKDEMLGPDIFSSGPKFDGSKPAWDGSIKITQKEQIAPAMDSLQEMGVDYFKLYDGNLTTEMYYELIKEAEKRGVKITGHMPMNASLERAIELGLDGIEHLYYLLQLTTPKKDSILALQKGYGAIADYIESHDTAIAEAAFARIGHTEFYATPTLYIGKVLNQLPLVSHETDSLLPLIGKGIQASYQRRIASAMNRSQEAQDFNTKMRNHFVSFVKPMHQAGITILAGSDCGASNSYVYPGESLIGELMLLVEAGLSPQEALYTSIINGPKFLGLSDYYGSIEAGKFADIIVLDKNPLDDIEHIKSLFMVVKGDQLIDKEALDTFLN